MRKQYACEICQRKMDKSKLFPLQAMRSTVINSILKKHPEINKEGYICTDDVDLEGLVFAESIMQKNLGELDELEKAVLKSLATREILSENTNEEVEESLTFGERLADRVSELGGSWGFILLFLIVLGIWMATNTYALRQEAFDPYPYILLNLVLSCLAALQAPVIMMSQNRKSDRDRIEAANDYKINLNAELGIRNLNSKIDHLTKTIWFQILETQKASLKEQKSSASAAHEKK